MQLHFGQVAVKVSTVDVHPIIWSWNWKFKHQSLDYVTFKCDQLFGGHGFFRCFGELLHVRRV